MRQQQTRAVDVDQPEIPLNPNEQRMLEAWLQGMTQTDCYRAGYGAEGYGNASLRVRACQKFAEPHIQSWIAWYRAQGVNSSLITLEEHIARLNQLAEKAERSGNYGAAVNAMVNAGKAAGLYIERTQDVTDRMSDNELMEKILTDPAQREALRALLQEKVEQPLPGERSTEDKPTVN